MEKPRQGLFLWRLICVYGFKVKALANGCVK